MEAVPSIQSRACSMSTFRNTTRHRPLYSCGVVILTIAHNAYTRAEHCNGAIGILSEKLATLFGPIVHVMLCQWLVILSLIDHQILDVERKTEKLFPASAYLFDKIDALVQVSGNVPEKCEDAVNKLLMIAYQVPFVNWALAQFITTLNFLIVTLTDWGIHVVKEKEIMIDSNSHESAAPTKEVNHHQDSKTMRNIASKEILFMENSESIHKEYQDVEKRRIQPTYKEVLKKGPTYKEVLEKGRKKESREEKKEDGDEVCQQLSAGVYTDLKADGRGNDDPILELFSNAWHIN